MAIMPSNMLCYDKFSLEYHIAYFADGAVPTLTLGNIDYPLAMPTIIMPLLWAE